jgi:hypothetical protein
VHWKESAFYLESSHCCFCRLSGHREAVRQTAFTTINGGLQHASGVSSISSTELRFYRI